MLRGVAPNGREAIDNHATTRNDVAGNAENAIAVQQPFDTRHLATQAVVGAFEASYVRRPERTSAGRLQQIAKSVDEAKHPSSYASPH